MNSEARAPLLSPAFVRVTLCHLWLGIGGAFGVHFSGFLKSLGAGEAEIGRVVALQALTALVLGPAVGKLMDRHGRPLALRAGGLSLCGAAAGYLLVREVGPLVYALRVLDGLGGTMLYAALFTYAADIVPADRRTQGLALFGAAGLLPLGISALAGDALLARASYDAIFVTSLATIALGTLIAWPLPDPRSVAERASVPPRLRTTARQRDLLPIWLAAFSFFFALSGLMAFLKTYVLATGRGSTGAFFAAYALTALALRVLFGALPDRVGARRMVLPSLLAYAAGTLALAAATDARLVLAAGALCGVGHGYAFPVFLSLTVSRARPEARGSATALFTTVDWAGNVAAPPLLGLMIERVGYAPSFCALAGVLLLGIVGFHVLDEGRPTAS